MTNYKKTHIKKVFNQADKYFKFVDGMTYKIGNVDYLNPYYINCLFCCELYLKTLLMIDGIDLKLIKQAKHDLKELVLLINDDMVRKNLIKNLNSKLDNEFDAETFLEAAHDDFTAIRYMYIDNINREKQLNDNFPCCIMFMYVLREYLDLIINGRDTYEEVTNSVSI